MTTTICPVCGAAFQGRSDSVYCGKKCRRRIERRRKKWDLRDARAGNWEAWAKDASPEGRDRLEAQAARLRQLNGLRP